MVAMLTAAIWASEVSSGLFVIHVLEVRVVIPIEPRITTGGLRNACVLMVFPSQHARWAEDSGNFPITYLYFSKDMAISFSRWNIWLQGKYSFVPAPS